MLLYNIHIRFKTKMQQDLFKEERFCADAVFAGLSHGMVFPQHLGFLLQGWEREELSVNKDYITTDMVDQLTDTGREASAVYYSSTVNKRS